MSCLSGKPSSIPVGTTSSTITLSPSTLISDMGITGYYASSSNWRLVQFNLQDATGVQRRSITFPTSNVGTFTTSATALTNTWTCQSIIILDNDGGSLIISRASFPIQNDFDIIVNNNFGTGTLRPEKNIPWSMSFWTRLNTTNEQVIFSSLDNTGLKGIHIESAGGGSNNLVVFLIGAANYLQITTTSQVPADSNFHHVVITYDGTFNSGSSIKVYIDGTLSSQTVNNNTLISGDTIVGTGAIHLGTWNVNGARFLNGYLDEYAVFNRALSSGEVTSIYNSGSPNDLTGQSTVGVMYAWYRFGDTSLSPADSWAVSGTLNDRAGGNHNGTKNGSTTSFSTNVPPGGFTNRSGQFGGTDDSVTLIA